MSTGRIVSTVISCAAVAGYAAVVVGMSGASTEPRPGRAAAGAVSAPVTTPPAVVPADLQVSTSPGAATTATAIGPASSTPVPAVPSTATPVRTVSSPALANPAAVNPAAPPTRPAVVPATAAQPAATAVPAPARSAAPARTSAPARAAAPAPARATPAKPAGSPLPLRYSTGNATRVVTVTAGSSRSTRATLQAWTKLSNGRWAKYGPGVAAYVGADGIGTASETRSKTPAGSFTVTQTFGRYGNPGTGLSYIRTTPSDYWISSPGSMYNTFQRCGSCGYDNGVNERLYYVTPFYNYAAVIDYNTRNAPGGVQQGRGSAFFLHVSTGSPTAGCIAIAQSNLVSLLRWLTPAAHPRILIGVT